MIDLCMLGSGGMLPLPERPLTCLSARFGARGFLLDCGEGAQVSLRRTGRGFSHMDDILLTHLHGDHALGLPGLLMTLGACERTRPLTLIGPSGLSRALKGLCCLVPRQPFPIAVRELKEDIERFSLGDMRVTAFRVAHPVPCYGYAFELPRAPEFLPDNARALGVPVRLWSLLQHGEAVKVNGRVIAPGEVTGAPRASIKFVYCTDTRAVPVIEAMCEGADLAILEGMYGDPEAHENARRFDHMFMPEAASIARRAGVKRVWLTHFSPAELAPEDYLPAMQAIFPATEIAREGLRTTLRYSDAPAG